LSADTLTGSTRKFFEILGKLLLRCWIFGFLLVFIRSRSDGRPDFPAQQQPMIIAQHVGRKPPESSGPGAFPFCARDASIASTAFPEFSVGGRWSTVLKWVLN
jgi:hypothetical protein